MAATEQFSLRWNNFHSNLTSGFHDLLQAADMVDVTLAVDGHFLQAHKLVLSICSPYFKQLFKINPCKHPIVILKDISHGNMKDILEFMYLGEVNVLRENLPLFLRTAELLQVKGLTGDDSSDTSSKKDEKIESFCDNDDESEYNQLIENDTNILSQYTPTVPSSPQQQKPATGNNFKRSTKNALTNNSSKRVKPDTSTPVNKSNTKMPDTGENTQVNEDDSEFIEVPTKLEQGPETDDSSVKKENFSFDSNNSVNSATSDVNMQDHASCGACGKLMRKSSIRRHMYDVHIPTQQLPCDICHKLFKTANSLTTHLITIHRRLKSDRQRLKNVYYV